MPILHFSHLAQAVCVAYWVGSTLAIPPHIVRDNSVQQRDAAALEEEASGDVLQGRGSGPSPGIGHGGLGKLPALQERGSGPSPGVGHGGLGKPPALQARGGGPSPGEGNGGKPPALQERGSSPSPGIGHGGVGKPPALQA